LADAEFFDRTTALIREDDREDYGERRFHATGWLRDHIHVLVYTLRGESVRCVRFVGRPDGGFYPVRGKMPYHQLPSGGAKSPERKERKVYPAWLETDYHDK
jgi:hypothetical protein